MDKMPCLPVKITDKKWADKLQDGYVFMRSLFDFGSWSTVDRHREGNTQMKSGVQGDISEGRVRQIDLRIGDDYFNSLPSELRSVMKGAWYIDNNLYQYCKIYCMYGLTYLTDISDFEKPDARISEFGDTAVIIYNPNYFLERVLRGLYKQYGDNLNFKLDEVKYYPPNYYGDLDEFCKPEMYAWQNEIRMRVALLNGTNVILDSHGRELKQVIQDVSPITVEIGDIRNISVQIPVQDFFDLKLPPVIQKPVF